MRLLRTDCEELLLKTFNDERKLPEYAILSHTWLEDTEEVTFQDLNDPFTAARKLGWKKLDFARRQARNESIKYVWLDTCCIDKSSSAELAEAINSMYRWYKQSKVCFVYLDDMTAPAQGDKPSAVLLPPKKIVLKDNRDEDKADAQLGSSKASHLSLSADLMASNSQENLLASPSHKSRDSYSMVQLENPLNDLPTSSKSSNQPSATWDWLAFRKCKWFTRGWTLQEMIAPTDLRFYDQEWNLIGTLDALTDLVAEITGVHNRALKRQWPIASFSIAQRMCWAADRETTRAEDRAYSLLGIFDISIPVIYGEGERAFVRLQQELLRVYSDQTIFAWLDPDDTKQRKGNQTKLELSEKEKLWKESHLLAQSPADFKGCERMVPVEQEQPHRAFQVTNREVSFQLPLYSTEKRWKDPGPNHHMRAVLNCCLEDDPTKAIALKLKPVARTPDSYYIGGIGRRVRVADLYEISPRCTTKSFSVLLSVDQAQKRQRALGRNTVVCRFTSAAGRGNLPFHFAKVVPAYLWREESSCFMLPSVDPTDKDADHSFKATITIHNAAQNVDFAAVVIQRGKTDSSRPSVSFQRPERSISRLSIIQFTNTSPMAVSYEQRLALSATVMSKQLLREKVTVVELEFVSMWKAAWLLWMLVVVVLLTVTLLPATVTIPILTLRMVRDSAYDGYSVDRGPNFDRREIIGLAAGITITTVSCVCYLLLDTLPLRWRPSSWKWSMPWALSLASLSICGVWDRNFNRRRSSLADYRLAYPRANFWGDYGPREVFTLMVLRTAASAMQNVLSIFIFIKDDVHAPSLYMLLNAGLNLATLVPLLLVQISRGIEYAPWTTKACQERFIPDTIDSFYERFANASHQPYFDVCRAFSNDGRLLLSVLSLGVWELVLEAIAIFQLYNLWPVASKVVVELWGSLANRRKRVKRS